jgi:hypothetical protein
MALPRRTRWLREHGLGMMPERTFRNAREY